MAKSVLNVPDISCEHCEHTITNALTPVDGVNSIRVDIPLHQVLLEYDPARVSLQRVQDILAEEDYPVASVANA